MRLIGHLSGEPHPYTETLVSAWTNVIGDATPATIRSSHGVSAFADNGAGDFTLTFLYPFASANYLVAGFGADDGTSATSDFIEQTSPNATDGLATTTARLAAVQRSLSTIDTNWFSAIVWGKV